MRRPTFVLILAAIVAILILWEPWARSGGAPIPEESVGVLEVADASSSGPGPPTPDLPGERQKLPTPVPLPVAIDDDFYGWVGTVTMPDGSPAVDAVVEVFAYPVVQSFRTDGDGRYRAEWSEAAPWDISDNLSAVHQGYWSRRIRELPPARPAARADFPLAEGLPVDVEVVHQRTGAPVEGVRLYVYQGSDLAFGATGVDGRLRLQAPRAGVVKVGVDWNGSGNGGEQQERLVGPSLPVPELRFEVLPYAERVSLHAVDASTGALLAEARYSLVPMAAPAAADGFPQHEELPSDGGVFEYDAPEEERPVVLLVEAPGYRARNVYVAEQGATPLQVPLERAETMRARVTVRGEAPGGPCRIRWVWRPSEITLSAGPEDEENSSGFRPDGHVRGEAVTDEQGYTTLPFRPHEDRFPDFPHLWAEGPSGLSRCFGKVNLNEMGEEPWVFELDPGYATVEIRAADAAGAPVAGLGVMVEITRWRLDDPWGMANYHYGEDMDLVGLADRGLTDDDGLLRLRVLAGTEFEWKASLPGHSFDGRVSEPLQREEVRVVELTPPGPETVIAGTVFFADGSPVDDSIRVGLWAESADGGRAKDVYSTDADGRFHFYGLQPGRYRVHFGAAPFGPWLGDFAANTGSEGLEIILPPLQDLVVRAVDARTGAPIDSFGAHLGGADWSRHTSSIGEYLIEKHFAALWDEITVYRDGFQSRTVDLRPLTPSQKADLEVALEPARAIRLTLRDASGAAADWSEVLWLQEGAEPEDPGSWDEEDDATWAWLSAPFTALRLQFVDDEGKPLSAVVEIPAGGADQRLEIPRLAASDR